MEIAIARLLSLKENMPPSTVPQSYVIAYNQILAREQQRTGIDLTEYVVRDHELIKGSKDVWYDRKLLALKIDNAIITLQAAMPPAPPRSVGF